MKGPKNDAVGGLDKAVILAAFRGAGVTAAPQVVCEGAWFDLS